MKGFLWRYPLLRRSVLAVLIYFSFHSAVLELKATRQFERVSRWPRTTATIRSSSVFTTKYSWSSKQNRFCPQLEYTYVANGQNVDGRNEVFDFPCWPDAYDFVAQHQPGGAIQIGYDPANPAVSVIPSGMNKPGYPWVDLIGGAVLLIVLLRDVFGSWGRQDVTEVEGTTS